MISIYGFLKKPLVKITLANEDRNPYLKIKIRWHCRLELFFLVC